MCIVVVVECGRVVVCRLRSLHGSLGLLQASDDEQAGVEETIYVVKFEQLEWSLVPCFCHSLSLFLPIDVLPIDVLPIDGVASISSVHRFLLPIDSVGEAGLL